MVAFRVFAWILGIFLLVLIIGFTLRGLGSFFTDGVGVYRGRDMATLSESELQRDFQNELVRRAVANIGQPIEGFDAYGLMRAFPGLIAEDFDGVVALEGYYSYAQGELIFVRDSNRRISTAEQALTIEGYDQLLDNLRDRFGARTEGQGSIDELMERIEADDPASGEDEEITVLLNERITAYGVSVTPVALLEDSRCPISAECMYRGSVRVKILIRGPYGESMEVISLGEPISIDPVNITLVHAAPEPDVSKRWETTNYSFTFRIGKNGLGIPEQEPNKK